MKRVAVGSSSRGELPAEKKQFQRRGREQDEAVSDKSMQDPHQPHPQLETVLELSTPFLSIRELDEFSCSSKACWKIAAWSRWRLDREPFVKDDIPPKALARLPHTLEPVVYYDEEEDDDSDASQTRTDVPAWVQKELSIQGKKDFSGWGETHRKLGDHRFEYTEHSTVWKCTAPEHSGVCCRSLRIPEQLQLAYPNTNSRFSSAEMMHWSLVNGTIVVVIRARLPSLAEQGRTNQADGRHIEAWFDHFCEMYTPDVASQLWGVIYDIRNSLPTEIAAPLVVQPLTTPALNILGIWGESYHGHMVRSANRNVLAVVTHFGKGQSNGNATELRFFLSLQQCAK